MKPLSFLSLAAVFLVTNCVMQLEDRVCFSRQENGLEWPLPNIKNPGILISHVAHCFKVTLNPLNSSNNFDRLHRGHCLELVNRTLRFLSDNKGLKVDGWICEALRQSYGWDQLKPRNHSTTTNRTEAINRESVINQSMAMSQMIAANQWDSGVWGSWSGILAKSRSKRDAMLHGTEESADKDQNAAYTNLASKNFGKYLIANLTNPDSLGEAEKKYIRVWENDEAIALGAVGLYCYVNGDLTVIRSALNV